MQLVKFIYVYNINYNHKNVDKYTKKAINE